MQPLDDNFARRLQLLTKVLLVKLREQWIENKEKNRDFDLDEYRKALAESDPEFSHWFEQLTAIERQELLEQLAIADSVAYAILWAMDHLPEHPQ
jgi:hypothetical protein